MDSDLFNLDAWSSFTSDADVFSPITEPPAVPVALSPAGKKITKRKSRAAKRSATTYITADVSNFREMVQQVTGVQFTGGRDLVWKPAAPKLSAENPAALRESCLPTLDTSSFLLESAAASPPSQGSSFGSPPAEGGAALAYDFDTRQSSSFHCFPTLESWRVM